MGWAQIKGQSVALQQLQNELQRGKIGHAYLFFGPLGVGKRTSARVFAQALNCPESLGQQPCGVCRTCRLIAAGKHPDVREVQSEGAQSNKILISQTRAALRPTQFPPVEGNWKVVIITQAEGLTVDAANNLLKTLEDPPEQTVIILTAQDTFKLLPTVLSRCQLIRFQSLTSELITQLLTQEYSAEPEEISRVANLAEGSMNKAQERMKNQGQEEREEAMELFALFAKSGKMTGIFHLETWSERKRLKSFLQIWGSLFRDIIYWQKTQKFDHLINGEYPAFIQEQASLWVAPEKGFKYIQSAWKKVEQNANGQLLLEVLLLELDQYRGGFICANGSRGSL